MQRYTTVSVKIPVNEREEIRRLKLSPSKLIRSAIKLMLREARIKQLKLTRSKMDAIFQKLKTADVTTSIREERDSR